MTTTTQATSAQQVLPLDLLWRGARSRFLTGPREVARASSLVPAGVR